MADFATRLKIALDNKGMKPSILAYRLNIHQATISNYLKGKYIPKTETVLKMCEILDCDAEWLSGYKSPAFQKQEFSPEYPAWVARFKELSEPSQKLLENIIAKMEEFPEEKRKLILSMVEGAVNSQE